MGRNAEIETETEMLKRIVALLFSFADLAERVSSRSYPVRCLVLWLLRRAEVFVRDWLAADALEDIQIALPGRVVLHRNSPAEALFLAQSFHALARMLKREFRLEEQFARRSMRGEASLAAPVAHRRLLAADTLHRLARTMRDAMRCLRGPHFEAAPRLDTS